MVICKFFAEGRCKFGSKCRFEHSESREFTENQCSKEDNSYSKTRSNSRYNYQANIDNPRGFDSNYRNDPPTSLTGIIKSQNIQSYNMETNNSNDSQQAFFALKLWIFSCCRLESTDCCLPGLVDYSIEEVRTCFNHCSNDCQSLSKLKQILNNTTNQYQSIIQSMANLHPSTWNGEIKKRLFSAVKTNNLEEFYRFNHHQSPFNPLNVSNRISNMSHPVSSLSSPSPNRDLTQHQWPFNPPNISNRISNMTHPVSSLSSPSPNCDLTHQNTAFSTSNETNPLNNSNLNAHKEPVPVQLDEIELLPGHVEFYLKEHFILGQIPTVAPSMKYC